MSVANPSLAIVLGSVTPPQGDVKKLTVHLGCTDEVSSFELLMHNWDKKYSPSGTYPIQEGANATIYVGRGSNCPLLLTGKIEKVNYPSTPTTHYVNVSGRCVGKSLFSKRVTKTYTSQKGEAIVKDLIDNYTVLSHTRSSVELIEDTDTTYAKLEYVDTPVIDILKYIASTADKSGIIGFDFRIAPDGKFEFFQKNSKTSSVSLTDVIEESDYTKDSLRIRNKVTIYGAPDKSEPSDKDSLTDGSENYLIADDPEDIHDNTSYQLVGTAIYNPPAGQKLHLQVVELQAKVSGETGYYKITYQKEGGSETTIVTDQSFTNTAYELKQHAGLDIWGDIGKDVTVRFYTRISIADQNVYSKEHRGIGDNWKGDWVSEAGDIDLDTTTKAKGSASIKITGASYYWIGASITFESVINADLYPLFNVWLERDSAFNGNISIWLYDNTGKTASNWFTGSVGQWFQKQIKVGAANADQWGVESGFDWTNIKKVRIDFWTESGTGSGSCRIDGLFFGARRYSAMREDAASQTKYDPQEYSDTDEELYSDNECDLRAKAVLDFLKEYAESSPIKSSVLDYGTTPVLPADKIHVALPNENVDANFRIQTGVEYTFDAEKDTLEVSFVVGREIQQLADYLYVLKSKTDQMSRHKIARMI